MQEKAALSNRHDLRQRPREGANSAEKLIANKGLSSTTAKGKDSEWPHRIACKKGKKSRELSRIICLYTKGMGTSGEIDAKGCTRKKF